jgi:hypothetical protein
MVIRSITFVLLFYMSTSICFAQEETINLGSISLKLGMSEYQVKTELEKTYNFTCEVREFTDCYFYSKSGPTVVKASIVFKNGMLVSARKLWNEGYEGSNPLPFVKTLFSLFKNFIEQGNEVAIISTEEAREPGTTVQNIYFQFGNKKIEITVFEGFKVKGKTVSPAVNLAEVIE